MKLKLYDQPIAEILRRKVVFEYPREKIWNPKGVSLDKRVKEDINFGKKVDALLARDALNKYIVTIDPAAPERCIDGRITKGWENFDQLKKISLGPKVPGGTAHAALTHRIVNVSNMKKDLRFEKDIEEVVKTYKKLGAAFGGHVDSHHKGWNTGCGAVDNINLILHTIQRPEPHEQMRLMIKFIMGESYDGIGVTSDVFGRMLFLDGLKPSYMPKVGGDPQGEYLYKKIIVSLLRRDAASNSEPVPELAGEHNEVAIVLNYVKGTTIDNDRFSYDNDNKIQIFGWDIWETFEEAMRLYNYSMSSPFKEQKQAIRKRMKYVTCRILLGIATVMVLTDGSLRVVTINGR